MTQHNLFHIGGQPTAFAYIRVSTQMQEVSGLGIDEQLRSIRSHASKENIRIIEVIIETASGKSLKSRPKLRSLLSRLDSGEADKLIVAKVDRLARNLLDLTEMHHSAEKKGWGIVTLDLDVDTSTPGGRFAMQVLGATAELERQMISDRTTAALAEARKRGTVLGAPRQIADATYARAIELRADGLSYRAIAAQMIAEGFTRGDGVCSWSAPTVRALCVSPYGKAKPEARTA